MQYFSPTFKLFFLKYCSSAQTLQQGPIQTHSKKTGPAQASIKTKYQMRDNMQSGEEQLFHYFYLHISLTPVYYFHTLILKDFTAFLENEFYNLLMTILKRTFVHSYHCYLFYSLSIGGKCIRYHFSLYVLLF